MPGYTAVVRELLSRVASREQVASVGDDASLLASGLLDSLGMVELVTAIEDRFSLTIGDDELIPEHFETVSSIAALLCHKLDAPREGST